MLGDSSEKCGLGQMPTELQDLEGGVICSVCSKSRGEGFKELSLARCIVFQKEKEQDRQYHTEKSLR